MINKASFTDSKSKPPGRFKPPGIISELNRMLVITADRTKAAIIRLLIPVCIIAGVLSAILLGNIFLVPVFAVSFGMIPIWYTRIIYFSHIKSINNELASVLTTVTTAYMKSRSFPDAVHESLPSLSKRFTGIFTSMLSSIASSSSGIADAVSASKNRLHNQIWYEWCDAVCKCQSDSGSVSILFNIVNKAENVSNVQSETDPAMMSSIREILLMLGITIFNIPCLRLLNKEWFISFTSSTAGAIVFSINMGVVAWSVNGMINILRPFSLDEEAAPS